MLVRKCEGKRPRGRPRRGWEDNIKTYLKLVECEGLDWILLAQDRTKWQTIVNTVINFPIPCKEGKSLAS
jgi:hypothetical protein